MTIIYNVSKNGVIGQMKQIFKYVKDINGAYFYKVDKKSTKNNEDIFLTGKELALPTSGPAIFFRNIKKG